MAYISFKPNDYFNTVLWTTDGTGNKALTTGHSTDMVWIKFRDYAYDHRIYDDVRGVTKKIIPNKTDAESTTTDLASFDTNGFTVGSNLNTSGEGGLVGWSWKANGSGSSNTDGTLTSTVSANTTSGFSIGTYTSDITSAGYKTVGHGLGKKPKIIITKNLGVAQRWGVQAPGILTGDSYILELNATSAEDNQSGNGSLATVNSNVFSVNWAEGLGNANSGGNYVFYAFTDIKGYSAMGSYLGNGNADGPFIYTGFKPALLIRKRTDAINDWYINDNKRAGYNPQNDYLFPNSTQAESALQRFDFLSNGFKIRTTDGGDNASGGTYIYMAFAEEPLVSSNGVPATAR